MPTSPSGTARFARFAYPPNALGYCGPPDAGHLLAHGSAGVDDREVADRARRFEGAWPYLEVIASAAGIDDPLDPRVVEAYWVGNELTDLVDPAFPARLTDRFRGQGGGFWEDLAPGSEGLARPHHSFHVFAVYPWVGLLGRGPAVALSVLDRCRIRWGEVVSVSGEETEVRSRPLVWDGKRLDLGDERTERVRREADGRALATGVAVGDTVALHWDWVCDRLAPAGAEALVTVSAAQLELANRHLAAVRG